MIYYPLFLKKLFKNTFSQNKKIIDYRKYGIGGWHFIEHLDYCDDVDGPLYRDTYQHLDGRKTYVYDDQFADDEELKILIDEQNKLKSFFERRQKKISNLAKLIFIPHWVLIGMFFVISIPQYGIWSLVSFLAYCFSFVAGFGFGVGLISGFYNKKEEITRILILIILLIVAFLFLSLSQLKNFTILNLEINAIMFSLTMGILRGKLLLFEEK
tara:strand:- start:337 stop:975 length:639 start_codon:yes stop_codon:yes gene_type:complete